MAHARYTVLYYVYFPPILGPTILKFHNPTDISKYIQKYRGSLPYATANFISKHLANAIFYAKYFITATFSQN